MCQLLPERGKKVSLKYPIFQTSFQHVGGFPIKFLLNLHYFNVKNNFIKVRKCMSGQVRKSVLTPQYTVLLI